MKTMSLPVDVQQDLNAAAQCMHLDESLNTSPARRKLALALLKRGCQAVVEQHKEFGVWPSKRGRDLPPRIRLHNPDAEQNPKAKLLYLKQPTCSESTVETVSDSVAGFPAGLKFKISKNAITNGSLVVTPEQAYRELDGIQGLSRECFIVLSLNAKNRLIRKQIISIGTVSQSLVRPAECFRAAIQDNAVSIILAHNHPSGDPTPSSDDIKVTQLIVDAGRIMSIKVLDHVIIGNKRFCSIREAGRIRFQ